MSTPTNVLVPKALTFYLNDISLDFGCTGKYISTLICMYFWIKNFFDYYVLLQLVHSYSLLRTGWTALHGLPVVSGLAESPQHVSYLIK